MNNAKQISNLFFIVSILLTSCNKERPIVLTSEISDITVTTATGGGEIASDGGESILTKGVCWSIEKEPTIDDQHTADGTGIQPFTSNLKGLAPGTVYYVRAYAVNVNGTGYGPEESFKTAGDLPSVNTKSANVISAVEAKLNGSVNANGLVTTVTFEYGTSNNYNKSVQAMPDKVSGDTISSVLVTIIGLSPSTTYHYRVKAENSLGISYGNDLTFNTASIAPDVTTKPATLVTDRTAVLNGNIDPNNLSCTVKFEYGTTTSYGLAIVAVPDELSGDSLKDVSATLTGLTPNTTYHYRIKASNSAGISEGLDNTFITVADTADATTLSASQVDAYTATLNGSVNPNNSSCVVRFEYRKANASYNIVAASPMNLNGNGEKVITASLSGLLPNTTYYYRVKAENTIGTAYGSELSFTTIDAPPEPLLTSVSSASVRYGSILTVYGANLGSITEVCIGSASQYIVVTPASMSADSIKIDIYNHENPLQLLPFSAFKIGIKYHGGSKWTDQVTISSSWKRLADFPSNARYKAGIFSIGGKMYIGCGADDGVVLKDFWKFDPTSDTWTKMADFPGVGRIYPFGVSSATNGYMGIGNSADNSSRLQLYDFYKYSPETNSWSSIPDYPDNISNLFTGFAASVNGHPYVGSSNTVPQIREIVSDSWSSRSGETEIMDNTGPGVFSIGNSIYVICGFNLDGSDSREVWEYNTTTDIWTQKADFPGETRHVTVNFSIGSYGYYGCGRGLYPETQYKDMWKYDPATDKWIRIEDFPGGIRSHTVSSSDGKKGYAGFGYRASPLTYLKDFWQYTP